MKWFWGSLISLGFLLVTSSLGQQIPKPPVPGVKDQPGQRVALSYVTSPTGSGNYTIAVGQAQVVGRRSNIALTVQPAAGYAAIPTLVHSKEALIGIASTQTLYDAYNGVGLYEGKKHPSLRVLQSGNELLFGFLTHTGTGMKSLSDLKGKRFTCDILTSKVTTQAALLALKAYGMSTKDVKVMKTENNDTAVRDLAGGKTDCVLVSLTGSKIEELATKLKIVVLPYDPAKFDLIQREMPALFSTLSKKAGPIPAGIPVMGMTSALFAHQVLEEETAYKLVNTLLEGYDDLKVIHQDFVEWTLKNAVKKIPVPYHPGAIRYYKEAGLWSAEMSHLQADLLK
jgi:TRAP transporter TAXI family solute receptor